MDNFPVTEGVVHELNREIASLRHYVLYMGVSRRDCHEMRDKLTKSRRRCMEICRGIKSNINPQEFASQPSRLGAYEQKCISSTYIGLKLLAKDLKILEKLYTAFPEKGISSLFQIPTTFMFPAAGIMNGVMPTGASPESQQIYRERHEVLELLKILSDISQEADTEGVERKEILSEKEKRRYMKRNLCGMEKFFCCKTQTAYS